MIGLLLGLATIFAGVIALLRGEQAAIGIYAFIPVLLGLIIAISSLISLIKDR